MKQGVILFVTHKPKQCGVYEFGKKIFEVVSSSTQFKFIKAECNSLDELQRAAATHQPEFIIYNYHPTVLPWLCTKISKGLYRNNIAGIRAIQVGVIHEVTQAVADKATGYRNKFILGPSQRKLNCLFDYYIAADPTLLLKNPLVYKTGRLVPPFQKPAVSPIVPTFGSFGFATPKKGFEKVVEKVQEEFDHAIIRLNMPAADFGDADGANAKRIAENCRTLITKPGISLEVSHDFLNEEQLLTFLAGNSMNVFLYEDTQGRGISSAIDNALAVKKPIAVSGSPMFRHVHTAQPSVCIADNSLKTILGNGFAPLEMISRDWNAENLLWEYERILSSIQKKQVHAGKERMGVIRTLQSVWRRIFSLPDKSFTWLRNTTEATGDDLRNIAGLSYIPVALPPGTHLNRILDDKARVLYHPATQKLFELAPVTMAKKIDRANVQQGFVFDTVYRFSKEFATPKLLCVGSYEDTASIGLQKMGFKVEDIDPMINYYLQEYFTRPSTVKNSYDIIFSTSVIEHDPDDESFIRCIEGLLAPGGYAVITCDYKDGWKPGEPKPDVDVRFYTRQDLGKRLMSYMPLCRLVDTPDWDCPHPDFNYLGKYQYTFATFVIQKNKS
jgi:SAM-dependent methyltransferase